MTDPRQSREAPNPPPDVVLERELRAVSALLRGLPDPEPPGELVERVMTQVAAREARPKVIRRLFGKPVVGTALAAGIAGLAVLGVVSGGPFPLQAPEPTVATTLEPSEAHIVAYGTAEDANARRTRRPAPLPFPSPAVMDPKTVAFFGPPLSHARLPDLPKADGRRVTGPLDRRLDHQLNQLLLDPVAFYQRLHGVRNAKQFAARLAERAARRGDAVEVALRLRQHVPAHAETTELVEQLLWAELRASLPKP